MLRDTKNRWSVANDAISKPRAGSQIEQSGLFTLEGEWLACEIDEIYSQLVIWCLTCIEKGFGHVLKFVDSSSPDWDKQGILFI